MISKWTARKQVGMHIKSYQAVFLSSLNECKSNNIMKENGFCEE